MNVDDCLIASPIAGSTPTEEITTLEAIATYLPIYNGLMPELDT